MNLTSEQQEALLRIKPLIDVALFSVCCKYPRDLVDTSDKYLVEFTEAANGLYREGLPAISDGDYDTYCTGELARRMPDHPFLQAVEPETPLGKTVKLPERMLSTNKAYSLKEIEKWAEDVLKVASQLRIGKSEVFFRITPKADGYAAYDDGATLYTRGDGRSGTDITRAFDRGMLVSGLVRGQGPGEIVVDKFFFQLELADSYENSRNIIAGVIKEGELDKPIEFAIGVGAVYFQPFIHLNGWARNKEDLLRDLEDIWEANLATCKFDTDGLVIEVAHPQIKEEMGHTNHHHRWQIAYKKNTEYHDIQVTGLVWQTSKNGRLTPVVQLEPTKVSGVTISRATGHNYGNVTLKGIDTGAVVRVCRSGLVIPYIESVITKSRDMVAPRYCPSCEALTEIDGDNLLCTNTETCPAQIEGVIEFFFKTLGNCDGFGPKVIEQFVSCGINSVDEIYALTGLNVIGIIKGKTGDNLVGELIASRQRPIEDWRFLAAFSIHNVGKGGCEKLLKHHRLADVFDLTAEDIIKIDGFAEKTAWSLVESLVRIKPQFDALMKLGFHLIETPLASENVVHSPIAGKSVVFTGTMEQGNRSDMEKQAKLLGAKVGSSVSSKTDYLVCGLNVGANKTAAALKHGVKVLLEAEYFELLGEG